jgi:hypothetical protein
MHACLPVCDLCVWVSLSRETSCKPNNIVMCRLIHPTSRFSMAWTLVTVLFLGLLPPLCHSRILSYCHTHTSLQQHQQRQNRLDACSTKHLMCVSPHATNIYAYEDTHTVILMRPSCNFFVTKSHIENTLPCPNTHTPPHPTPTTPRLHSSCNATHDSL